MPLVGKELEWRAVFIRIAVTVKRGRDRLPPKNAGTRGTIGAYTAKQLNIKGFLSVPDLRGRAAVNWDTGTFQANA